MFGGMVNNIAVTSSKKDLLDAKKNVAVAKLSLLDLEFKEWLNYLDTTWFMFEHFPNCLRNFPSSSGFGWSLSSCPLPNALQVEKE
jgi:hypothetical protein